MIEKSANTEEKNRYQSELFANRLAKNLKQLRKWARRSRVTCYRLYDRDIPEIPLACDIYTFLPAEITDKMEAARFLMEQNTAISANGPEARQIILEETQRTYAHIYLYERPYEKDDAEEDEWLKTMAAAAAKTLGLEHDHVITKTRRHQSDNGKRDQYDKIDSQIHISGTIQEQGQLFKVNLTDYIDTGIFFDHRPLRDTVRSECAGKTVLNLFCYTGSFSVYAAEGRAKRVESVDMSKTYTEWAKSNLKLNGFTDEEKYPVCRQDAVGFLNQKNAEVPNKEGTNRYDIIILDPPTFSNSKRTDTTLDINRDWISLVAKCLLMPHYPERFVLYFPSNWLFLHYFYSLLYSDHLDRIHPRIQIRTDRPQ